MIYNSEDHISKFYSYMEKNCWSLDNDNELLTRHLAKLLINDDQDLKQHLNASLHF